MQKLQISGPTWDNTQEYPSLESEEFLTDYEQVQNAVHELRALLKHFDLSKLSPEDIPCLQQITTLYDSILPVAYNLRTFARCVSALDGKNAQAQKWQYQINERLSELDQATKPLKMFWVRAPEAILEKYLDHPRVKAYLSQIKAAQKQRNRILSVEEENLISQMSSEGLSAWSSLYSQISSRLSCQMTIEGEIQTKGLAQAASIVQGPDAKLRKAAWEAIEEAWKPCAYLGAQALNSMASWRLKEDNRRSHSEKVHFLDRSLFQSKIKRETLVSMMGAIDGAKAVGQKAIRLSASFFGGQEKLDPWNLLAPAPTLDRENLYTFEEAIDLICSAFNEVSPDMAAFVRMMVEKKWIEASAQGESRAQGAHCTMFAKSRTPRVYMTYQGSVGEILTLAHELGHAFHNWVLKDKPLPESSYPMTLAETASIFAETVVSDYLLKNAKSRQEQLQPLWEKASGAHTFLLNIPARFEFERSFYEKRKEGPLSAEELTALNTVAWEKYYGDGLSSFEELFWLKKLHFYISGVSFYNFPYPFGYLFALLVYVQKDKLKEGFYPFFCRLLEDTGTLEVEELITTHFKQDPTSPAFWQEALDLVAKDVDALESWARENL